MHGGVEQLLCAVIPCIHLFFIAISIHAILDRLAAVRQDVIQRIMCVIADSEIVVACIEHIGLIRLVVIGCIFILVCMNGDRLRFAGLEHIRLFKANQLNRGLFDAVGDVGLLRVQLHKALAFHRAVVRHLHGHINAVIGCL